MEKLFNIINTALSMINATKTSALVIFSFFSLLIVTRIRTRSIFNRAQKLCQKVSLCASQYFQSQSSELKAADWRSYRWVCTNWGFKSPFRSFRAVFNLKHTNNPLFALFNFIIPQEDLIQVQLKLKLPYEAYGCVVRQKKVSEFSKQFKELLSHCVQGKQQQDAQTAESFSGLASMIQIQGAQYTALNGNTLECVFNAKDTVDILVSFFKIADNLINYQLTEAQAKQNQKRIEISQKQMQKLQQQKQVEEDEEKVQQKMDELAQQFEELKDSNPAEAAKVKAKLDGYKKKQQIKVQKQIANQMGLGNQLQGSRKGQRQLIMK